MRADSEEEVSDRSDTVRLMLGGDVMTGRGIDQILPAPGDPAIREDWRGITDARVFVEMARRRGRIPVARDVSYIWGDLPGIVSERRPDLRIVNLETALTSRGSPWTGKHMHFRMNPENAGTLAGKFDCCTLANNHVLDWGYEGLTDTLDVLRQVGMASAGAGENKDVAATPAVLEVPGGGRVLVWSVATPYSGVPAAWSATAGRAGVWLVMPGRSAVAWLAAKISARRRVGDIVVLSIHWGGNWGYRMHEVTRRFAHALIDRAGVDVIHGHSSHHVRGIEVYRGKLILYGCGDLINDYEGIDGYDRFRPGLGALYFADIARETGQLRSLKIVPVKIRNMRVNVADKNDVEWIAGVWSRLGTDLGGTRVAGAGKELALDWHRTT
jgi:poly-gamma-glutamate synthesis protein (capsule biosynthesis protein)